MDADTSMTGGKTGANVMIILDVCERAVALEGGMKAWREAGYPVA